DALRRTARDEEARPRPRVRLEPPPVAVRSSDGERRALDDVLRCSRRAFDAYEERTVPKRERAGAQRRDVDLATVDVHVRARLAAALDDVLALPLEAGERARET